MKRRMKSKTKQNEIIKKATFPLEIKLTFGHFIRRPDKTQKQQTTNKQKPSYIS